VRRPLAALAGLLALAACGEPAADWPAPSPALWEVSGPAGEKAWLFGTIHALPDGAEWRTATFERAFADSGVVLVEIGNLGESGAAARVFRRLATTPALPPLSARIAPADRPALAALMERAGLDDADFRDTETWAAALILNNAVREAETGNGVDRDLLDLARPERLAGPAGRRGKPVEALETFASQFARFDELNESAQRALLASIAREALAGEADERIAAWIGGDMAALERAPKPRRHAGSIIDPGRSSVTSAGRGAARGLWRTPRTSEKAACAASTSPTSSRSKRA
jgi:uncharacterized protein YbaP (TraB family)